MNSSCKRLAIIPLGALASCVLAVATRAQDNTLNPNEPILRVSEIKDRNQTSRQIVESPRIPLTGAIMKTLESTTVSAAVPGLLEEYDVEEGNTVAAGQIVGLVRDHSVRLQLSQLKTQWQVAREKETSEIDKQLAKKSLEVAATEYERALKANERVPDTYPLNEIDRLRLVSERAKLEVERAVHDQKLAALDSQVAKGEYDQAFDLFQQHKIRAPVAGVVVAVEKRLGEWVEPGTDLFRVVRLDRLRVEGFIDAKLASLDLVGKPATLRLKKSAEELECTVSFVSPDINTVNSTARVYLNVENSSGKLRPGIAVDAWIESKP